MFHELVVYRFVLSVVYRLISVYRFLRIYTNRFVACVYRFVYTFNI